MVLAIKEENGFRYIEVGEGPVLLLLHGLMGNLSNWNDVINEFKFDYKVVIPMLPIYELPILTTGVKTLAKFVHKFVKFKNFTNITVLGNSLGGHVGLIYVSSHPQFVKALVLTGSSGLYENAFGGSFPKRENYDFIKSKVEFTFYNPEIATKELVDEVYQTVNDRTKIIRLLAMAKSAIRHNMSKDLHHILTPVMLIWGRNDKITPPEVAKEFEMLLPNAQLAWIEECGHAPMMEQPEAFNIILRKFLQSL